MKRYLCIAPDVVLGKNVKLSTFINLYGCEVGDETKIGAFVEIQKNAKVGKNCKISSHSFICEGVTIEDDVFIGHGVTFINDTYPRATVENGGLQTEADWTVERTLIKKGASVGSGATILANVTIGERAIVGAGSVVTKHVPPNAIVAGNPACVMRLLESGSAAKVATAAKNADSPARIAERLAGQAGRKTAASIKSTSSKSTSSAIKSTMSGRTR
ncbi:MAG TPA: acyltransferase [Bryobacteraceae bacterium]|nr:acyltransferase [Bryobacteraceae bacterium]